MENARNDGALWTDFNTAEGGRGTEVGVGRMNVVVIAHKVGRAPERLATNEKSSAEEGMLGRRSLIVNEAVGVPEALKKLPVTMTELLQGRVMKNVAAKG